MTEIERKMLQVQVIVGLVAPFLAALGAIVGVALTLSGNLELQRLAEARADRRQENLQTTQLLAEQGDVICGGTFEDTLIEQYEVEVDRFCAERLEKPPSTEVQRELIRQLVEHPEQRQEILAMWRAVFRTREWIDRIEAALVD